MNHVFIRWVKYMSWQYPIRVAALLFLGCAMVFAQDPGSQLGNSLTAMFSGTLATGIALAGIVIGGMMLLFGGGQAVRVLGGLVMGLILVLDGNNIIAWVRSI